MGWKWDVRCTDNQPRCKCKECGEEIPEWHQKGREKSRRWRRFCSYSCRLKDTNRRHKAYKAQWMRKRRKGAEEGKMGKPTRLTEFENDPLTMGQFADLMKSHALTPQQKLAGALIHDAVDCVLRPTGNLNNRIRLAAEALTWLRGARDCFVTFKLACAMLNPDLDFPWFQRQILEQIHAARRRSIHLAALPSPIESSATPAVTSICTPGASDTIEVSRPRPALLSRVTAPATSPVGLSASPA